VRSWGVSGLLRQAAFMAGSHEFRMPVTTQFVIHSGALGRRVGCTRWARPGYAEIRAASALHPDSGAWAFFMREIVRLPREMTPAVFHAIRQREWALAPDPLATVRSHALRVAKHA
jgi:hypothetical protein